MKLKTVKKYMSIEKPILIVLSIIACVLYFIKIKAAVYMVCGLMIISIGIYFVMALSFWRCPHCHRYLPLKNTSDLTVCPECQRRLFEKED